jgi:predicted HicB family RNase H-like nuclease
VRFPIPVSPIRATNVLRVSRRLKEAAERKAREQGRSLSNYIARLIERDIGEDVDKPPRRRKPQER